MTDAHRALLHAAAWGALTAALLAVGAFISLQFPAATDSFETPHRPTSAVVVATIAAWSAITTGEISLAARNPHRYPANGPIAWLILPTGKRVLETVESLPELATRLLFYAFLFSLFPMLVLALTTTIVPWVWVIAITCGACIHLALAVREDRKWRKRA